MLAIRLSTLHRGETRLLTIESLEASAPGITFLVGPGGAGKSSLLTALAGAPGPRLSATPEFGNRPWAEVRKRHVPQGAQLARDGHSAAEQLQLQYGLRRDEIERDLAGLGLGSLAPQLDAPASALDRDVRRVLAVLAGLSGGAEVYFVDEPCADLADELVRAVRERLADLARGACVLVATHNRQDCLFLGGQVALLAGGCVQEFAPSRRFFGAPATHAGRIYVDTGNCNLPASQPQPASPDGLWWPVPGLLCGMSRPNLLHSAESRLREIAARGIRHLVCLEERVPYAPQAVRDQGVAHYHFPVPDMAPPGFNQAVDLCRTLEPAIRANQAVAMHCRGGLGRTGTGLAALLIWFGDSADEAIAKVRRAQPLAIQSAAQLRFLHDFADRIRGWHSPATPNLEVAHVSR